LLLDGTLGIMQSLVSPLLPAFPKLQAEWGVASGRAVIVKESWLNRVAENRAYTASSSRASHSTRLRFLDSRLALLPANGPGRRKSRSGLLLVYPIDGCHSP
jgi:hypothetical protein